MNSSMNNHTNTSTNSTNELNSIPTHLLKLCELSIREKEKIYELLLANECQLRYNPITKEYLCDLRLLSFNYSNKLKRNTFISKTKTNKNHLWYQDTRMQFLLSGESLEVLNIQFTIIVKDFQYHLYYKFVCLLVNPNELNIITPQVKTLSKIMILIEDIYDIRYLYEKKDIENEDDIMSMTNETNKILIYNIFPFFVFKRFSIIIGNIPNLLDQEGWDFLFSIEKYKHYHYEIEIFVRLLSEAYTR